jgi:hypothetical protein
MARQEIIQQLKQLLAEQPEVQFAYLHGSFIEGLASNDVDVALYVHPLPADLFDYTMTLSMTLTRRLRRPVDIQALNNAPLGFQHQVLQGQLLFARNESQLTDYIEAVANQYTAFAHYIAEYLEAVTT